MRRDELTSPPVPNGGPRLWAPLWALAIFAASLAAYYPALRGGLVWDDAAHVTAPRLRTLEGLRRIWLSPGSTQQYYPVLHSAFWLEHRLWGDSVLGYHLTNVLLHATAACLFALLLARVLPVPRRWPGAVWLAAAVFALHPVCVESVAWISEQKNTLSLVFYLLAALAYLRFDRERKFSWYLLAFLLFALAILSKSVTATLPAALLLMIALERGRISFRRDALPLLPWFAVGIGSGLFTAWFERAYIGARGGAYELGGLERTLLAGRIVWFYLGKLVWPSNLTFIYPRWRVAASWSWSVGTLAVVAVGAVLWAWRGRRRAPLIAFLFFVGSLFPALGFLNVYPFIFSYVADHFQYLACLGVIALLTVGGAEAALGALQELGARARSVGGVLLAGLGLGLLAVLFVLTWRQSGHYRDSAALYRDTLLKNPECWMAENNLGVDLMDNGAWDEAIPHLRRALDLRPGYSDAHNNLGNALTKIPGHAAEAISEFEAALRLEPGMAQAHANLGLALSKEPGRRAEGIAELEAVLRGNGGDPEYAQTHADLAVALAAVPGQVPRAIAEFQAALALQPGSADMMNAFGIVLAHAGRPQDALGQFEAAVQLRPDNSEFHNNLGSVLSLLGRGPAAIAEYRQAVRLDPRSAGPHFNLGRALRGTGDDREAIAEHREAERLAPDSAEIRSSLGSVFFRRGQLDSAIVEYREAVRLDPSSPRYRYNLGVALSEAGAPEEAIGQFRSALRLDPDFADAHYNLGVALRKTGRDEEARAEFVAAGRTP